MRKELLFGFSILGALVIALAILMPWGNMTSGHYGLLMLALIVAAIMLGFPTAFTLMGMGVIFAYLAYHDRAGNELAIQQTLDLMVQRTYAVMTNDVLIAVPLFVFMGYLVERANLIERLFRSMHLALARVPGSLAVATLFTCAVFATATGIVGAVVTLMGLLAFPAMLRAGYGVRIAAGVITAGGCLGILIPPSVMLIVYGATAGVSVVRLYAGAFFPGLMLAGMYVLYVVLLAKIKPSTMPPLSAEERRIDLPRVSRLLHARHGDRPVRALMRGLTERRQLGLMMSDILRPLMVALLPAAVVALVIGMSWRAASAPDAEFDSRGLQEFGSTWSGSSSGGGGLAEPPGSGLMEPPGSGLTEPPRSGLMEPPAAGLAEPPRSGLAEPPGSGLAEPPRPGLSEPPGSRLAEPPGSGLSEPPGARPAEPPGSAAAPTAASGAASTGAQTATPPAKPLPAWFWWVTAVGIALVGGFYLLLSFPRLEILQLMLVSFFPLSMLILAVLGSIIFGLATPSEAAAMGAFGGFLLAVAYRAISMRVMNESVFLTAKTTAMVCWLFVGSSIFSAAFALLGGQELIERWVLSLGLTKIQFLLLTQVIIFLLGWPLEWTEIIVIFMPIFIPLLVHFDVDPLFFGLLVALNLQTAFLSPPVAMAAFYLKGVAPPHVTLGQIFMGMMPFMGIQIIAMFVLYVFPAIGLWLPSVLYR